MAGTPHFEKQKDIDMKNRCSASSIKALALITTILFGALALSACNTIEGAGKDIERAGEEVQDAAN